MVELLIVVVIIGILAGSMLLVMGSGKARAEATRIVSEMRVLKSAAVVYSGGTGSWPDDGDIEVLKPFLDHDPDVGSICTYSITNDGEYIFIKADVSGCDQKTKDALALMAPKNGLLDMAKPLACLPSGSGLALLDRVISFFEAKPAWSRAAPISPSPAPEPVSVPAPDPEPEPESSYYSGGDAAYMQVAFY